MLNTNQTYWEWAPDWDNPNLAFLLALEENANQPSDNKRPIITLYWQGASFIAGGLLTEYD